MILSPCCAHFMAKKKKKLVNVIKFWNSFRVDGKKKKLVIWFLPRSKKNLRTYDCYCCCNFVVYLLMLSSPPKQDSRLIDRWWWQQSLESIGKLFLCCWFHFILIANMADVCRDESEFAPVVRRCDGQQEALAGVGGSSWT